MTLSSRHRMLLRSAMLISVVSTINNDADGYQVTSQLGVVHSVLTPETIRLIIFRIMA